METTGGDDEQLGKGPVGTTFDDYRYVVVEDSPTVSKYIPLLKQLDHSPYSWPDKMQSLGKTVVLFIAVAVKRSGRRGGGDESGSAELLVEELLLQEQRQSLVETAAVPVLKERSIVNLDDDDDDEETTAQVQDEPQQDPRKEATANENEKKVTETASDKEGRAVVEIAGYVAVVYYPLSAQVSLARPAVGRRLASDTNMGERNAPMAVDAAVPTEGYVGSVLTVEGHRRRGVCSTLLREHVIPWSAAHMASDRLKLHVRETATTEELSCGEGDVSDKDHHSSSAAFQCYRALGFEMRRRMPNYYGRGVDGLELQLQLQLPVSKKGSGTRKRPR